MSESRDPFVLRLAGAPALSAFRRRRHLEGLRERDPSVRTLEARWWYLVHLQAPPSPEERRRLAGLLGAGDELAAAAPGEARRGAGDRAPGAVAGGAGPDGAAPGSPGGGEDGGAAGDHALLELIVVPRIGTISPWASKATDIAHGCGFDAVRRIERAQCWRVAVDGAVDGARRARLAAPLHDRMTQSVLATLEEADALFRDQAPVPGRRVPVLAGGADALRAADAALGLALAPEEIEHLVRAFTALERDPTDTELMMFAQANSEHCRHKIFNAEWRVDGVPGERSLFDMIRNTYHHNAVGVLSAYADNAAVFEGHVAPRWVIDPADQRYRAFEAPAHVVIKVETHNHPTAISPHPGAATGAGGEIRDEGATGRGARPKAGLTGFTTSNLRIPGFRQPWEGEARRPDHIASPLAIMLEGPIGGASFNNEFGRPNLLGYFRTFEQPDGDAADGDAPGGDGAGARGAGGDGAGARGADGDGAGPRGVAEGRADSDASPNRGVTLRGYHKPIMIAGGHGNILPESVHKERFGAGACVVVLGGPAMQIGLGGGAASSVASGTASAELDFASVQRDNPEMQRRAQEVIDRCWTLRGGNPILSVHDVGAGGLSNAIPELLDQSDCGGDLALRAIPSDEPGMSPLAIWCNESQERYVLAIAPEALGAFEAICARERCPMAVLGTATATPRLTVRDAHFGDAPVDMPMEVLLGRTPRMQREVARRAPRPRPFDARCLNLAEAVHRVLAVPAVADKSFLITIGDRTVGGLVSRDQMVGPWQVPVSDVAVTLSGYAGYTGEASAMGERTPVAVIDPAASGRLAVTEAITNIVAADVARLADVRLSANWMAACGVDGEDANLWDTVHAVGMEFCPALGLTIPVGKDSLSMQTRWRDAQGHDNRVYAPVSLIVSAFAPVRDVRRTLTPQLSVGEHAGRVWLLDLGSGRQRLGGSALAQAWNATGELAPDIEDPAVVRRCFDAIVAAREGALLQACHDRSDGGAFTALLEMAFAGNAGLTITVPAGAEPITFLFNEEAGLLVQVAASAETRWQALLDEHGLADCAMPLAEVTAGEAVVVRQGDRLLERWSRAVLRARWSETSYRMCELRDNPECAREAHRLLSLPSPPKLVARPSFELADDVAAPFVARGARPRAAILREQGVNGHLEMAAAFDRAGFECVDVHMSDLQAGPDGEAPRVRDLADFSLLAACGGFSYGDVLGAGNGWATSILFDTRLRDLFGEFFARPDTLALGVCNGCQMLSRLRELIPGTDAWPAFVRNRSEQFEARLSLVEVPESASLLTAGMAGSIVPIVVSHGEGRAVFPMGVDPSAKGLVTLRFVTEDGEPAMVYPLNPNGSPGGVTGLCNEDGRVTIMMPHPERVFRTVQQSWHPPAWREDSPWMRLFRNARVALG